MNTIISVRQHIAIATALAHCAGAAASVRVGEVRQSSLVHVKRLRVERQPG